ncbi:hypothetical protein CF335_g8970, partial [Tilletia laevis]
MVLSGNSFEGPYDWYCEIAIYSLFARFLVHVDATTSALGVDDDMPFVRAHLKSYTTSQHLDLWMRFFKLHIPYRRARLVGSKQASLLHTHQTPPCLYPCIARAFRLIPPHITVQQTDHNTEAFPSKAP